MYPCRRSGLCELRCIFLKSPFPESSNDPQDNNTQPSLHSQMPPSLLDPKVPTNWHCTCKKCGTNGQYLSRTKWYLHNPGGNQAKYRLSAKEMETAGITPTLPHRANRTKKRRRHVEVEEVEDSSHVSKRVAGSSSVRITLYYRIYAPRLNDTYKNMHLECSLS